MYNYTCFALTVEECVYAKAPSDWVSEGALCGWGLVGFLFAEEGLKGLGAVPVGQYGPACGELRGHSLAFENSFEVAVNFGPLLEDFAVGAVFFQCATHWVGDFNVLCHVRSLICWVAVWPCASRLTCSTIHAVVAERNPRRGLYCAGRCCEREGPG